MRRIIPIMMLLVSVYSFAQTGLSTDQTNYQNKINNPQYWKNRLPYEGYWQQDVHYKIKASIDDVEEVISGQEELRYYNNSPDTLYEVYFHLYQNAFTPNSYAHELRKSGKIETVFGENEAKGLGTTISIFLVNGKPVKYTVDNTILKVKLTSPLMPGDNLLFNISFKTYFDKNDGGNMRRRMKSFEHSGVKHFDGVHWYPRISVYDRKFGWTTDQHIGKEFYGDFGQFEVELTFPNQYIVEATGTLQNQPEVMPSELRKAIDLSNYKTQRTNLTEPIKADGTTKTWKYYAINVHDFAFTADPTYRIGEAEWKGIKCIAIAMEEHAHLWQESANYMAKVIEVNSRDFGMYQYPKIVAADARDGMEYPMLTLDGGTYPGHRGLLSHEISHNWFYGMVGNNETYRAGLDEGFTQFLTAWTMKHILNQTDYNNLFDKNVVFERYLDHSSDENNATLNVHSDYYNSADRHGGGYSQVYFKTASMLYNLQYVLGDELFLKAMKNYFNQWKFCHPYWADFRTSVIRYTKVDLNWFFDQWINTTKTIDYSIESVKYRGNSTEITLERKTEMHMPLDVKVVYKDGTVENHLIPNTYFTKKTDAIVNKTWIGWDDVLKTYTFNTATNKKVKEVIIDPSGRLADINRLNNSTKCPVEFKFSKYAMPAADFTSYKLRWHPNVWYNGVDGIKAGLDLMGNYADRRHIFNLSIWYNTGVGVQKEVEGTAPVSYAFDYKTRVKHLLDFQLKSKWLDGANINEIGFIKYKGKNEYYANFKSLYRQDDKNLAYLIFPELWNSNRWNNSLNAGLNHPYKYFKGDGMINLETRAASIASDYNYAYLKTEVINNNYIKKLNLRTRFVAQFMSGSPAPESQLMLSGANNEEMMDNAFTRSVGVIPADWEGYGNTFGHFQYGGGLNLRAFTGYKATNTNETDSFFVFSGTSGAALNVELDFQQLLDPFQLTKIKSLKLNTYLFGDAGVLYNQNNGSGLRADAGIGTALTFYNPKFSVIKPVVIRVDFPFFANRIPASEDNFFAFRYLIGISRAF